MKDDVSKKAALSPEDQVMLNITRIAREMSTPSNRPRRRQPKHKGGLVSSRQRVAFSQSGNLIAAMYKPDFNQTPTRADTEGLTLEVGPGDVYNLPWSQQRHGRGQSGEF